VGLEKKKKKYDKSIELLHKALAMDNSVYRNLTAIGELGAVHGLLRKEALNKGDAEMAKKHAEFTLEYYAQYTKKLDSAGAEDLSDREKFDLQQRLVFFKRTEADLLRDVQEDMNASLTKRNEALALLSSNPELTERGMLQGMGFDTAFFLKEKAVQCLDELKKLVPKDVWIERLEQMQEHAVSEHELAEMLMTLEFKKSRPWGPIIGVNVVLMSLIFFLLWRKVMNR
jgi:tetratricopeptide (TPR) repeat protein